MYYGVKKERLFTNQQLLALLWPLIIEQALGVLVGMADTVMVSSVGEAAISGVSLVDMINQLIITVFGALATGGAVVTSQHLGAKRPEEAARSAGQLVGLSGILGMTVAVFCLVTRTAQLRLFFGTISEDVMQACLTYFTITALSFPFLALYNAGAAIFRSTGNSAVSMKVSVLVNAINFCGNALCVFVLRMGVAGVAVPTWSPARWGRSSFCHWPLGGTTRCASRRARLPGWRGAPSRAFSTSASPQRLRTACSSLAGCWSSQ